MGTMQIQAFKVRAMHGADFDYIMKYIYMAIMWIFFSLALINIKSIMVIIYQFIEKEKKK